MRRDSVSSFLPLTLLDSLDRMDREMKNRMTRELKQAVLDEDLKEKKREVHGPHSSSLSMLLDLVTVGGNERYPKSEFEASQRDLSKTQRGERAREIVYPTAPV
jgi:hypothetical protein